MAKKPRPLTPNEARVLRFFNQPGHPTYREVAQGVGLSDVTSAVYVVNSLIDKGFLEKSGDNISRSIVITDVGWAYLNSNLVSDLRKMLEERNGQVLSESNSFHVNGAETPQKLETNYWQDRPANGTGFNDTASLGLEKFINTVTSGYFNPGKSLANRLLTQTKENKATSWALIFSLIIFPVSKYFLGDQWLAGVLILSLLTLFAATGNGVSK